MKVLYLHIGTPKTGTTSLQSMMANNRTLLEKYGIAYPDPGFRYPEIVENRNGHFLVAPVQNPDGSLDRTRPAPDYEAGLNQLSELAEHFDTVVLSDEGIYYSSLFRPDFWAQLNEDLQKRGFLLKVILYLRRQDLFMESLYAQRVRQQNCSLPFSLFVERTLQRTPTYEINYYLYLEHIAAVIGRENLIVRVFEKEQFKGESGSLYADFLQIFNLKPDEFLIEREIRNPSLGGEYLEIKRVLNALPEGRPEQHLLVRNMMKLTETSHPGYSPEAKFSYFEPDARDEFLRGYEESNRQVARVYLHREDGVLFHEEVRSDPTYSSNVHDLLYCTILAYGDTLEKMSANIKSLRADVKSLRDSRPLSRLKRLCKKVLAKLS